MTAWRPASFGFLATTSPGRRRPHGSSLLVRQRDLCGIGHDDAWPVLGDGDGASDADAFAAEMLGGIINSGGAKLRGAVHVDHHAQVLRVAEIFLGIEVDLLAFLEPVLGGLDL